MSIVREFARFAGALRWNDVPDPLRSKVEDHLLDTLGVMCVGTTAPESGRTKKAATAWGGQAACTVVGSTTRLPAPHAAFLNAFNGRIHTYDDTLEAGPIHSGSVVIAAALASAEAYNASGATLLAGILAGYEVVARIVAAFGPAHYAAGFHTTGTCNVFGAATAAGHARGLDAAALSGALGLAGGMASGLRQYQIDGAISDSAMNGAHAALAGVMTAELAAAGLAGPEGVLDGKFGLGTIAAREADFSRALNGLGDRYLFSGTAIKPYPSCRFTHGPLHVLAQMQREHALAAEDIESIEIATFHQSIEVSDKPIIASRTDALLSHQTSAALLLTRGSLDLAALDSGAYRDPAVVRLAACVRVVCDATLEAQYPAAWPHRITVLTRNGRTFQAVSQNPPGGIDNPLSRSVVETKFLANAGPVLGEARAEVLLKAVRRLHRDRDTSSIAASLQP